MSHREPTNTQAIVKAVTTFVIGASTTAVTSAIVRNNVSEPETKVQKATLAVGNFAIGAVVAEKTREWSNRTVDKMFDFLHESKDTVKDAKAETQS